MRQKSKLRLPVRFAKEAELTTLKIVVVYDAFPDLIRFHEMWCRVLVRLMHEIEFHSCVWNFGMLRDPLLREYSARYTAEADMIVISANGHGDLPGHMKDWIHAWLPDKAFRRAAMIAMLDHQPARTEPLPSLRDYLQQIAEKGGMDFFYKGARRLPMQEVGAEV